VTSGDGTTLKGWHITGILVGVVSTGLGLIQLLPAPSAPPPSQPRQINDLGRIGPLDDGPCIRRSVIEQSFDDAFTIRDAEPPFCTNRPDVPVWVAIGNDPAAPAWFAYDAEGCLAAWQEAPCP
jgi:hypothetical protein